MTDPADWKSLSPAFMAALRRHDRAARARVLRAQRRDAITAPLYHYTDRGGLAGIITAQIVWFTHYHNLNDDREIKFGMSVANSVLSEIGDRLPKARIFCDLVADLFSAENLDSVFDFYIASFSRRRDDPHHRLRGVRSERVATHKHSGGKMPISVIKGSFHEGPLRSPSKCP
jgi:hypothetical protein